MPTMPSPLGIFAQHGTARPAAAEWLAQSGFSPRSLAITVLRAVVQVGRRGGGRFDPETLRQDFGIFIDDSEHTDVMLHLLDSGLLAIVAVPNGQAVAVTPLGDEVARYSEWLVSSHRSSSLFA